jgi:hypothetical protein
MTIHTLTSEELTALMTFAAAYGRCWKQELREAWMSGDGRDIGLLRQLRNDPGFGPQGLINFRLAK